MPVARIITTSPAAVEELRRQLTAAGYSVKFAAPDEEFSDADVVVAAANVHRDYALQYASEVAAEADADVIVAPGVVPGSVIEPATAIAEPSRTVETPLPEQQPAFFATTNEAESAPSEPRRRVPETLAIFSTRVGDAWQAFRQKRELAAEQKRLEREQREMEREEQRRVLQQQRMEAEARMAAERERLRVQRQAEQERLRREQEEMRLAMEAERARIAAERERLAQTPPVAPVITPTVPVTPAASRITSPAPVRPAVHSPRGPVHRPAARRVSPRDRRFQKAAVVASVVALVAMVAFAVAMNLHPSSPMPHSMVQNPVQEKSPFGAASITPATTTVNPRPTPKPTALPQHGAAGTTQPAHKTAKPSPSHTRRVARDNYVADDEVVVHHYGTTGQQQKHPPAAQTQAGIRKYTDQ